MTNWWDVLCKEGPGYGYEMRKLWDVLCKGGPSYGYFPLPAKTVLIVKHEYKELALEAFEGTGVKITTEGERHMGAVIGSETFKELYVKEKVERVRDVEELAEIAKDEPQVVMGHIQKQSAIAAYHP